MERNSTADLIGLVAITSVFVIGLHQLGSSGGLSIDWSDPIAWANRSAPEDVMGAGMRLVGLGVGYYILANVSICLATSRHPRRSRWVRFVTLPVVRRMVDRALAATLAVSIVGTPLGPAIAEQAPAPVVFETSSDGIPVPHVRITGEEEPITPSPTTPDSDGAIARLPSVVATPVPTTPSTNSTAIDRHTVERGDNLWTISASRLTHELGSDPTNRQIADYWRLVVDANRGTLRSGDPNLIFPGEVISLPKTLETP